MGGKLGVGKASKFSVGVIELKKGYNQVLWNHSVQQGFNIGEIVFCRQPNFHNQVIGSFCHIR